MTGDRLTGHAELDTHTTLARIEGLLARRDRRDQTGQFYVEGVRNFLRASDAGYGVEALLYSDTLLISGVARMRVRQLLRQGVPAARASPEQFRQISQMSRASGIGAILRVRTHALHALAPRAGICWTVLRTVRSPGNLGSLLRSSAAVGGAGMIFVGGDIDPYQPAVIRASMGAIFRQTLVRTGMAQLQHWVRRHRLQVLGASPDGQRTHFEARFRAPTLLVLGDERSGIDEELRALCDDLLRIPMVDDSDSLNVAVAGGLVMYEVLRQRRRPSARSRR